MNFSIPAWVFGLQILIGLVAPLLAALYPVIRGTRITVREAMKHLKMPVEGARVVVQGCGNVGGIAAMHFDRLGAKVIAISDSQKGIYNENGFRDFSIINDSIKPVSDKRIALIINVEEGIQYYLRNVDWVGNSIYTKDQLNK
jgi:glutamate dehydrogenase/leucine dehydrogenase